MGSDRGPRRGPGGAAFRKPRKQHFQSADPCRAANDPQVKTDGHHARRMLAFAGKTVEGGKAITGEILAMDEMSAGAEAHVVGVEGIGKNHMVVAPDRFSIGQIIVIGV